MAFSVNIDNEAMPLSACQNQDSDNTQPSGGDNCALRMVCAVVRYNCCQFMHQTMALWRKLQCCLHCETLPMPPPVLGSAALAQDLLTCARLRGRPTLTLCGSGFCCVCHGSHVPKPFVLDDAVWGFSLKTLQSHIKTASFVSRMRSSIDMIFVDTTSSPPARTGCDIRRLQVWETVLTHFVFIINTDLSGQLEVSPHRVAYRLPLFNKSANEYTMEVFLHEESHGCCGDCSVRWDLVCTVTQRRHPSNLSSVLYAASWEDDALVDACTMLGDERNPLVAFVALAHIFISAGAPSRADLDPHSV